MAASEAVPGRAVLRGLGLGFAALAALLLVALLALWGLLATAFGRDLLLDRLLAGLPAERLQIGAREGSLAGGLRLHDVVYSDAQQRLSIDRLELRPAWPGLAPAELRLRLLRVQGLQQQRLDAPDAPQRSWAETLQALGKQIAMHIAAANPLALSGEELDPALIERERAIAMEKAKDSGKPQNIVEKMVEGSLAKFRKENALLSQLFVIDNKTPVADVVATAAREAGTGIEIASFVRFQLGEGIEKKQDDFAAEVAAAAGVKNDEPVA